MAMLQYISRHMQSMALKTAKVLLIQVNKTLLLDPLKASIMLRLNGEHQKIFACINSAPLQSANYRPRCPAHNNIFGPRECQQHILVCCLFCIMYTDHSFNNMIRVFTLNKDYGIQYSDISLFRL